MFIYAQHFSRIKKLYEDIPVDFQKRRADLKNFCDRNRAKLRDVLHR